MKVGGVRRTAYGVRYQFLLHKANLWRLALALLRSSTPAIKISLKVHLLTLLTCSFCQMKGTVDIQHDIKATGEN